MLVGLVVVTGFAQGLNILTEENLGREVLPSWALGTLELGLIIGFTLCICTVPAFSARSRSPAEVEKAELAAPRPMLAKPKAMRA